VDLFAFVPPMTTVVNLQRSNTSAVVAGVGNLSATDLTVTGGGEAIGSVKGTSAISYDIGISPIVLSEYQGLMYIVTGGTDLPHMITFTW
jgi:hypothetical protein